MAKESRKDKRIVEEVLGHLKKYQSQASERLARYDKNKKWFETDKKHYEDNIYYKPKQDWQPLAIANIIEANIRTIVAVLTDAKPIMRAVGVPYKKLNDDEINKMNILGENLDNVLNHIWRVNNMHEKMKRVVLDGCLTGTMCFRVFWDKQRYDGMGEVGIEPIHPRYIHFDQTVTELNVEDGSCDWFIYAVPKPLSWFQYYWPDKEVKALKKDEEQSLMDKGLYIEAYKADYEIEKETTDENGTKVTKKRVKYPKGRRIIIGTDTLLDDGPIDVFPFAVQPISNKTETYFGEDDVYRQVFLQNELDQKLSQISTNIALAAVRQSIGDDNSGMDIDEYAAHADEPGFHFHLEGGADIEDFHNHFEIIQDSTFEPDLMNYPFIILEFMEKVTGVTKLIQGMSAKRERQTGFEVGKMLETATIRLRERAGHVEHLLRRMGLICLEYVKNNYLEERDVWHIDMNNEQVVANTFKYPTEKSKISGEDIPVDYEFDVVIQPDSTLPIDLNSMADLAMRLKERGVITNAEVLKRTRYPDLSAAMPDQVETPQGQPAPPPPPTGAM